MATQQLKEFEPFFGDDQKGPSFVQAMFPGADYSQEYGLSGVMTELLRANNFKNFQNNRSTTGGQMQGPEDVHQDVTDLIINTALFHRAIDKPTSAGTNVKGAIQRIAADLNKFLDVNVANIGVRLSTYSRASDIRDQWIYQVYPIRNIVGTELVYTLTDLAIWDASHTLSETSNKNQLNDTASDNADDEPPSRAIANLVKCRTAGGRNICWDSVLLPTTDPKFPNASDLLTKIENTTGSVGLHNEIVDAIEESLRKVLTEIVIYIKKQMMDGRYGRLLGTLQRGTTILGAVNVTTVNNYLANGKDKAILNLIKQKVNEEVPKAINQVLTAPYIELPHTDVATNEAKQFFEAVYKRWGDLPRDLRNFYGQNVSLFARAGSAGLYDVANDAARKQNLKYGWIRLTLAEVDALFAKNRTLSHADLQNLRVNLMKNALGNILFASHLPDVPSGANVWYTQRDLNLGVVQSPPEDFFRALYNHVYTTQGLTSDFTVTCSNGSTHNLVSVAVTLADRKTLLKPFNLNQGKFLSAVVAKEDELVKADQAAATTAPTSADPSAINNYPFMRAYDMVYGQIWTYDVDKQQYYRQDANGKRKYYDDEAKGDTKTCYSSYLGGKGSDGCKRVIECIASGDSRSLNRCLDVLCDADLWQVASDDAIAVGPDIIRLVLRKFGVKGRYETDSNGDKYKVPISYEEWWNKIVNDPDPKKGFNDKVKEAINKNQNLQTYLKGLIGVCRSNLSVLNKGNPSITRRENLPDYIKNLNMRKYKIPSVGKKAQYEFFADALRNATVPVGIGQSWFNPITSGQLSNVGFFNPLVTAASPLLGGNPFGVITPSLPTSGTSFENLHKQGAVIKDGSGTQFKNLLVTITNAFTDSGLQLHPSDQEKIKSVIKELEKYETALARLYSVLLTIVRVSRFYGISLENIDRDHPRTIKLDEISSIDDIQNFLKKYAKDLSKNMLTNMTVQQAVAFELMNKVGPRLIDECVGKTTTTDSTTTAPTKGDKDEWVEI